MLKSAKKLLSFMLAVFMLVGMLQAPAFAADAVTIRLVPEKTDVKPGETVKVDIVIENNVSGLTVADFKFDAVEGITYSIPGTVEAGYLMAATAELTDHYYSADNANRQINFVHDMNTDVLRIAGDGALCSVNVAVSADAAAGATYELSFADVSFATYLDDNYDEHQINPSFVSATLTVAADTVAVTGVELDKTALEFTLGSEKLSDTLTATVSPADATNKNVVWSSSDENVAAVENGVVTAKAAGSAVITVTTEDGGKTATCNVTVKAAPVLINDDHADMNVSSELVTAGDDVQMLISVENDEDAASAYNSYEFVVSYDSANLTYKGFTCDADENCAVTNKGDGQLIINGYGEIKTVSENAFVTLNFVAANDTDVDVEAKLNLDKAYRDTSEMAINRDIDEIEVETASKTVTIQPTTTEYEVTFSETVKVNGEEVTSVKVKDGQNVVFEVIPQTGKDYKVEGATKVEGTENTYEVTAQGDTEVTITHTAKKFDVTINDVDGSTTASATYGEDFEFTVADKDNYRLGDVKYSIGDGAETIITPNADGKYVIPGDTILGEVTITITRTYVDPTSYFTVTYYKNGEMSGSDSKAQGTTFEVKADEGYVIYQVGNAKIDPAATYTLTVSSDVSVYMGQKYTVDLPDDGTAGGDENTNYGTDYDFTVEDGFKPVVEIGGEEVTPEQNDDGSYTIPGDEITGDVVIKTEKIAYAAAVKVYDYVKTQDAGKAVVIQLVVATPNENVADDEILQYNGQNMFWSSKYNGYAFLVLVEEGAELLTDETAAANIGKTNGAATATEILYNGNVNMTANDVVDVNDAQLVYDIYKAMYSNFDAVTMEKMLRADMNAAQNDAEATYGINVNDVLAVMAIVKAK